MTTGDDRRQQIPSAMPVDANGNPIPMVTPGDWGGIAKYPLTVPGGAAVNLMELLLDQHTDFPSVTLELTFWSLMNFTSVDMWIGGEDVAVGEDYPLAAATDEVTPGFHSAKDDPKKTWILLPGSGEEVVILHLHGKNIG